MSNLRRKGMSCPFCTGGEELPVWKGNIREHLLVTIDANNHTHVHGPISDKKLMRELILIIAKEAKIEIEDEEQ